MSFPVRHPSLPVLPANRLTLLAALFGLLAMLSLAGCGDDDSAATCTLDTDCAERGLVCGVQGACVAVECTTRQECGQNRQCFEGKCTGVECTADDDCASDPRFGTGYRCISTLCQQGGGACTGNLDCVSSSQVCDTTSGQCVDPPSVCAGDSDCVYPGTCDTTSGSCVSGCVNDSQCSDATTYCAANGECLTGCREGNCPAGQVCNPTTRQCGGSCTVAQCAALGQACDPSSGACVPRDGKGICETCTLGSDECGGPGDRCAALGGNTICTFACQTHADCPSGFECQPITTSVSGCIPLSRSCDGCMVNGCAADQVCNPETAACVAKTPTCDTCQNAVQCGPTATCVAFQGRTRCLELCSAGNTCATGYTCNATTNACEPDSGQCTTCNKTAADCPGQELDEDACACVDCLVDGDCTGGGQVCAQGPGECVAGSGSCTSDADCGGEYCYGALPPERSGACVECTQNAHCNGATCTNFTCQTCNCPAGQSCGANGQCLVSGACTGDADCQNTRGAEWLCEAGSQLCYVPGTCNPGDPTVAPCLSPSSCGADMLTGAMTCQGCDMLSGSGCRAGETCFDLSGLGIPLSLGCMGGGGLGFP